ncbi:MAG TPA: hypothetical protein VEU77_10850 [Candidatus Acidoferrales bacterium]|nr:hypothetical protein [Candidatus Acidoferrales bacterium]
MTWRRLALAASWIVAAGWGILYLVAFAPSSAAYVGFAVAHFAAGYAFASALMARQMTATLAMVGTSLAGALTILALHSGTTELLFAPFGPIAAVALSDTTNRRNVISSVVAFALGFVALIWLVP